MPIVVKFVVIGCNTGLKFHWGPRALVRVEITENGKVNIRLHSNTLSTRTFKTTIFYALMWDYQACVSLIDRLLRKFEFPFVEVIYFSFQPLPENPENRQKWAELLTHFSRSPPRYLYKPRTHIYRFSTRKADFICRLNRFKTHFSALVQSFSATT